VDAVAIFATPFNHKGSCHALTICWLCVACPHRTPLESSQLYSFLTGLLPRGRGGLKISRVGGSNGLVHCSKEFFSMLHLYVVSHGHKMAFLLYKSIQESAHSCLSCLLPTDARRPGWNHTKKTVLRKLPCQPQICVGIICDHQGRVRSHGFKSKHTFS
jgi:hypothetical protein